ncbi:unnamed protein product [Adineta ricciae]|uniref:Uncharacterized protein n=1 Tax=Adineta ricciae TaxID=249248 RepID=A0A815N343_ADIRI|nr:unnamed protein product [Adineta ricciae]CAF1431752.1 unnamed protein product [Adineta ricciae]
MGEDVNLLKQLIEQDLRLTLRCLAEHFGCSHFAVEKHLIQLDKTWKYGVWIPQELSLHQLQHRVDACMDLMTSHRNYQWLSPGQTGVATPKPDFPRKKMILSVWRGLSGIIHWKIFPTGYTLTTPDQILQS